MIYFLLFIVLIVNHKSLVDGKSKNQDSKYPIGYYKLNFVSLSDCDPLYIQGKVDTEMFNKCEFTVKKISNGHLILEGKMSLLRNETMKKALYGLFMVKNGKKNVILNKTVENPCTNLYIGFLMKNIFGSAFQPNCNFKKGIYVMQSFDIDSLATKIIGQKFFYGMISTYLSFFTTKGMSFCLESYIGLSNSTADEQVYNDTTLHYVNL